MRSEFTQGWQSNNAYRADRNAADQAGVNSRMLAILCLLFGGLMVLLTMMMAVLEGLANLNLTNTSIVFLIGLALLVPVMPLFRRASRQYSEAQAAFDTKWKDTLERIDE